MSTVKVKGSWDVLVSLKKISGSEGAVPFMKGVLPRIGSVKRGCLSKDCLDLDSGLPLVGEPLYSSGFNTSEVKVLEEIGVNSEGQRVFKVVTKGTIGMPSVYEMTVIRHKFLKNSI